MKAILIILICTTCLTGYSQNNQAPTKQKTEKEPTQNGIAYRLFPTQNMWTFIKLNTRNGLMLQVQYDINGSKRFETYLNLAPLARMHEEANDRFTLYPTQNIYNFILLDQVDGRLWQVQWSTEIEKRLIIPIENELSPGMKDIMEKLIKADTMQLKKN